MKIKKGYVEFCNQMKDEKLTGIGEGRESIQYNFDDKAFFTWPRNYRCDENAIVVFDSDGMGEPALSVNEVRAFLIDEADGCLEVVRYDERY